MKLQRQHFLLSYLKTLSVGPVGVSNSRPPASQPGAQPSEQETAHLTVFRFCIMAGVLEDYSQLFCLFHASVIKRFVRRENPERELQLKKKKFSDTSGEEDSIFVAETASLLDLFPELSKEGAEVFKTSFHDFSVNCGIPIATMCKKPLLLLDNEWKKTV